MNSLKMENLEKCFETATKGMFKLVGVKIEMQGFEKPEIIINSRENFKTKLEYYKKAYDENLILKSFNGIKIVGFTYGDNFKQIQDDLL